MPKNISKELEKAILSLSQKEKDRHLLRLIAKNELLLGQMQYNLLEDESDLGWRREEIKELLVEKLNKKQSYTGFLLKDIRAVSAKITWHRRVTKDKYGEVDMVLSLLESVLTYQSHHLDKSHRKGDTLRAYMVRKANSEIKYIMALHEDFHIDFETRMDKVLKLLHTFETKYDAKRLLLPDTFEL